MTVAVLDACVLYPPSLRDLLMWLATEDIFEPRVSEEIHSEWIRNVLADNPEVTPAQLDRTRHLINQVTPECLVSSYEAFIPVLVLPDANDRHVLAAAIQAKASLIVTYNLSDFPNDSIHQFGIQAKHPDIFLASLFDEERELFLLAVRKHRASLHNPPKDATGYIQTLRVNRLRELAARLTGYEDEI